MRMGLNYAMVMVLINVAGMYRQHFACVQRSQSSGDNRKSFISIFLRSNVRPLWASARTSKIPNEVIIAWLVCVCVCRLFFLSLRSNIVMCSAVRVCLFNLIVSFSFTNENVS